jgi:hypothetical protein
MRHYATGILLITKINTDNEYIRLNITYKKLGFEPTVLKQGFDCIGQ